MSRTALFACLVAVAGFGPAAPVETARIGGLDLAYDPTKWWVEPRGALRTAVILRDRHDPAREGASLVAELDYGGPCSQEAMAALAPPAIGFGGSRDSRTLPSGLVLHTATGDSGCRNRAPARIAACIAHQGHTVLFRSPPAGCRGWGGHDDALLAVLEGLRPR